MPPADPNAIAGIVGNVLQVGFSVSVAAYLLIKTTAAIDRLTDAVRSLTQSETANSVALKEDIKDIRSDIKTIADAARRV